MSGQHKLKVTRAELSGRMKSKLDVYRVLTKEGQYYLPPYTECTMDFMADVIQGKKKVSTESRRGWHAVPVPGTVYRVLVKPQNPNMINL